MWPTLTQTYVLSRFRVGVEMNISFFIFLSSCSAGLLGSWVYSERPYFNWIKSKKLSGSVSCNNDFLNIKISTSTTWGRPVRTNQQEKSTKTHRAEILSGVNSLGVGIILFPLSSVRAMQIPRPDQVENMQFSITYGIYVYCILYNFISSYLERINDWRQINADDSLKIPRVPGQTKVYTSIKVMK